MDRSVVAVSERAGRVIDPCHSTVLDAGCTWRLVGCWAFDGTLEVGRILAAYEFFAATVVVGRGVMGASVLLFAGSVIVVRPVVQTTIYM